MKKQPAAATGILHGGCSCRPAATAGILHRDCGCRPWRPTHLHLEGRVVLDPPRPSDDPETREKKDPAISLLRPPSGNMGMNRIAALIGDRGSLSHVGVAVGGGDRDDDRRLPEVGEVPGPHA